MANYCATARSNYFRVKDAAAFEAWCDERFLDYWQDTARERYAISASGEYASGSWPWYDHSTDAEIDIAAELVPHLHPKDVAVLIEVGSEKLRYLIGQAVAVHASGRIDRVSLDDIYDRAMQGVEDGVTVTEATY
jgi:hypothetical protein